MVTRDGEAAEEAANSLRCGMQQSAVGAMNNVYLGVFLAFFGVVASYVAIHTKSGLTMNASQKFGTVTVIGAVITAVAAIFASENWQPDMDFFSNLLICLRLQFGETADYWCVQYARDCVYALDVPTKYVVLVCLTAGAYGYTTFLGISPIPWRKKVPEKGATDSPITPET